MVLARTVPPGAQVGYACAYVAEGETRLATIAAGYADDYREASAPVALSIGTRLPI